MHYIAVNILEVHWRQAIFSTYTIVHWQFFLTPKSSFFQLHFVPSKRNFKPWIDSALPSIPPSKAQFTLLLLLLFHEHCGAHTYWASAIMYFGVVPGLGIYIGVQMKGISSQSVVFPVASGTSEDCPLDEFLLATVTQRVARLILTPDTSGNPTKDLAAAHVLHFTYEAAYPGMSNWSSTMQLHWMGTLHLEGGGTNGHKSSSAEPMTSPTQLSTLCISASVSSLLTTLCPLHNSWGYQKRVWGHKISATQLPSALCYCLPSIFLQS